ncbi:MAG: M20/M25/M40 family metallo-hydrolase, partial [Acidimicrobiales bacterium]
HRGPFSGDVDDDGYLWGRGALDMKNETASRAVALGVLARSGFRPRGDIVFIAQADEEDGTDQVGLSWLRHERPDLACTYALDEGGGRRLQLADGRVVVTLDVGSKATLPVLVTALGRGGHASVPPMDSAVLHLATLIERLGSYRSPPVLTPETRHMLELLAAADGDDMAAVLVRAKSLHPWVAESLDARLGTTIAPTRLRGAPARNVVPSRASVECDCRVLPGWTSARLEEELREALGADIPYELDFLEPPTGGTASPVDTPLYRICQEFLDSQDPGSVLLPTVGTGFTDSHFMRESFGTVAYGICPLRHSADEVYATEHAENERIHVDDLVYGTRFHLHVAQALAAVR